MTVGKTIPYNDKPIVSTAARKGAPFINEPSLYGHAGHPSAPHGELLNYKPVSSYGHIPAHLPQNMTSMPAS